MDAMTDEFHDEASYGALLADEYDAIYGDVFDTEGAVDQLARLADGGRILEFGVGTGRIALPLADKGLDVWGVDGSPDMLKILKEKPGGDKITTLCGDFATTTAQGKFDLVVLLINTIYAMGSQQGQIECFENAARHLTPGGRFVIEAWVPDPPRGDALGLKARRLGSRFRRAGHRGSRCGPAAAVDHADRYRRNRAHAHLSPRAPLRLAERTGPHGSPEWDEPRGPLGRLARSPLRRTQHRPRIGVAVAAGVKGGDQ